MSMLAPKGVSSTAGSRWALSRCISVVLPLPAIPNTMHATGRFALEAPSLADGPASGATALSVSMDDMLREGGGEEGVEVVRGKARAETAERESESGEGPRGRAA
eukprot:scaffold161933_cov36-Tisochrysis_lutea.AAC.3